MHICGLECEQPCRIPVGPYREPVINIRVAAFRRVLNAPGALNCTIVVWRLEQGMTPE